MTFKDMFNEIKDDRGKIVELIERYEGRLAAIEVALPLLKGEDNYGIDPKLLKVMRGSTRRVTYSLIKSSIESDKKIFTGNLEKLRDRLKQLEGIDHARRYD